MESILLILGSQDGVFSISSPADLDDSFGVASVEGQFVILNTIHLPDGSDVGMAPAQRSGFPIDITSPIAINGNVYILDFFALSLFFILKIMNETLQIK